MPTTNIGTIKNDAEPHRGNSKITFHQPDSFPESIIYSVNYLWKRSY